MTDAVGATQEDARKRGLKFYRGPRPCKRGHTPSVRRVSSRECLECSRAHNSKAYAARRRGEPKPAPVVVKAPEPTIEREVGPGAKRHRFKFGGWADIVEIHSGTAKLISDCVERVFGDAPRIGHERPQQAAA
jgi:hypothetical protein